MTLTTDDVRALNRVFDYDDYEFTRGFAYLTEQAICRRFDEVDPAWCFVIIDAMRDATSASVVGRLTIKSVERDGVGTQSIEYQKDFKTKEVKLDEAGNPREAGEVRKGAATDALKRAARLFGVGRHILDAPKLNMASSDYNETRLDRASEQAFRAYLARCGGNTPPASPAQPTPASAAPSGPVVNGWTSEQANSFNLERRRLNVTDAEVAAFLHVDKLSQYEPGFSAAMDELRKFDKARPANPAPLPPDLFADNAAPEPVKERSIR